LEQRSTRTRNRELLLHIQKRTVETVIRNMCILLARIEKRTIEVIIRGMCILAIAFAHQDKQKRDVVDSPLA
jgi:intracellular sulfur oxidation DsrE/DsrF family protein